MLLYFVNMYIQKKVEMHLAECNLIV